MADHAAGARRFLRGQRGSLSVEAAYVLPVVIAAAMMFMELANIGLTINMGASALERAVQQFRQDGAAGMQDGGAIESLVRSRMVAASHNYLDDENIATVEVERFASLDAMGGGAEDDTQAAGQTNMPAWRIEVDVRKDFITPLPRLLGVDSGAFRYRYQQVLAYLPQRNQESQP
ncbi:TadE/TadG family type IV pilus assembly protein [Achromobacter spanius]|uniref:TadE/TadG family type IV pilus assembly protein n=1 Tax=Achromobacter spanius TaxID=217203 RepID=UPI003821C766